MILLETRRHLAFRIPSLQDLCLLCALGKFPIHLHLLCMEDGEDRVVGSLTISNQISVCGSYITNNLFVVGNNIY